MCEYCLRSDGHASGCPYADEPKVMGECAYSGEPLYEDEPYFEDENGNLFISEENALKYYGVQEKEWDE